MAPAPGSPSPKTISKDVFYSKLHQYDDVLSKLTATKQVKPGKKSLQELDDFRYRQAIDKFGSGEASPLPMTLQDVKMLVEWKLQHGKFRPTLMKLVSQNDTEDIIIIMTQAIQHFSDAQHPSLPPSPDRPPRGAALALAITHLCKLRGVGSATASLLLAVHFPAQVIFFSDEAFEWLCCSGHHDDGDAKKGRKVASIKYTVDEYVQLMSQVDKMRARLGVTALEVEKVAYVIIKQQQLDGQSNEETQVSSQGEKEGPNLKDTSKKRKTTSTPATDNGGRVLRSRKTGKT